MSDSAVTPSEELIVLLDSDLRPIGSAPKLASHHGTTPLHLAFSCYIFDADGRFLLTRRSLSKKVWPGVWTNSVCGHPGPDESLPDAILRRSAYELGISAGLSDITSVLPDYRYRTPPFDGVIENEFCPVYVARLAGPLAPNADEVEAHRWVTWRELPGLLAAAPDDYSYWMKDQLRLLDGNPVVSKFTHP
jgi:isopentenyl-diphosphate Delta-isomerase